MVDEVLSQIFGSNSQLSQIMVTHSNVQTYDNQSKYSLVKVPTN